MRTDSFSACKQSIHPSTHPLIHDCVNVPVHTRHGSAPNYHAQGLPPSLGDQFSCHVPSSSAQTKPRRGVSHVHRGDCLEGSDGGHRWLQGIEQQRLMRCSLVLALVLVVLIIVVDHLRHQGGFGSLAFLRSHEIRGNGLEGEAIDPEQLKGTFRVIVFGGDESGFLGFGHDRRQLHLTAGSVPGRRRVPQLGLDLGPLHEIVPGVRTVGSRNHRLGNPPAVDPDDSARAAAAVAAAVLGLHLEGRQDVKSLRTGLHPGGGGGGSIAAAATAASTGPLLLLLGTEAADREADSRWSSPGTDQYLPVVSESSPEEAPAVGMLLARHRGSLVDVPNAVAPADSDSIAAVPNGCHGQLLVAILDRVPFFQESFQLPASEPKGSDAQAAKKDLAGGSQFFPYGRCCRHCESRTSMID
mmetsp:Transcript_8735/g.25918  ORF Transcript_8735/g.25918 Transcript_8735/m.25918 type:complete len:413 (+) Transcript_8735:168-1406(+)